MTLDAIPSPTPRFKLNNSQLTHSISEDSVDDDSYFVKNSEGYKIEVITDEMKAVKIPESANKNRLFESNSREAFNFKSKIKKSSSSNEKKIDSLVEVNHFSFVKINKQKRKDRLRSLKG